MRIVFDGSKGFMPIACEYLNRNYRRANTKWMQWNEHWLPVEVNVEMRLGKPGKPSSIIYDHCEIYWVLGDAVADQVFDTKVSNFLGTADLRDAIMRYAINR